MCQHKSSVENEKMGIKPIGRTKNSYKWFYDRKENIWVDSMTFLYSETIPFA